jgi:hypothetical protein
MATAVIIHSIDELKTYKEIITSNLNKGIKLSTYGHNVPKLKMCL